jgi:hypothetical protein
VFFDLLGDVLNMNAWIIGAVLVALLMIIILSLPRKKEGEEWKFDYLNRLAKFLEGTIEKSPNYDYAFVISFLYNNKTMTFEDIEEEGLGEDKFCKGVLRCKTAGNFAVSFTERAAASSRSSINFVGESSDWSMGSGAVSLPKELQEFECFTNDAHLAQALFKNVETQKIFIRFKNFDSRKHPIMALEVIEGFVTLTFRPQMDFCPNLSAIQDNPMLMEGFVSAVHYVTEEIDRLYTELKR